MTLRELGTWIADTWRWLMAGYLDAWRAIFTESPLDWPLWLLGVVVFFVCWMGVFFLGEHKMEDGTYRRGWRIFAGGVLGAAGWLALYAAAIAWLGLVLVSGMAIFMEEVVISRWWGALGLAAAAGIAAAARWVFQWWDTRKESENT